MPKTLGQASPRYGAASGSAGPRLGQKLGFALGLIDPLSRRVKLGGKLSERRNISVAEALAHHRGVAHLLRQTLDGLPEPPCLHLFYDGIRDVAGRLVDDQVLEARRPILARAWLTEACGARDGSPHLPHPLDGPAQPLHDLSFRGPSPEFCR